MRHFRGDPGHVELVAVDELLIRRAAARAGGPRFEQAGLPAEFKVRRIAFGIAQSSAQLLHLPGPVSCADAGALARNPHSLSFCAGQPRPRRSLALLLNVLLRVGPVSGLHAWRLFAPHRKNPEEVRIV